MAHQPWICAPGIHHDWVVRGSMELRSLANTTCSGYRAQDHFKKKGSKPLSTQPQAPRNRYMSSRVGPWGNEKLFLSLEDEIFKSQESDILGEYWHRCRTFKCGVGLVVSMLAVHPGPYIQATGVKVSVTAQIQVCNGVSRQFGSCLKWRSRANKPRREGWRLVWNRKTIVVFPSHKAYQCTIVSLSVHPDSTIRALSVHAHSEAPYTGCAYG